MNIQLRIGQRVRRINSWDGRGMEGQPSGPELTVTQIFPGEDFLICRLSDGRHEFEFNLVAQESNAFAVAAIPAAKRVAS